MENLKHKWDSAASFAGGDVSERWWEIIKKKYSEDGRVYHNHSYLKHLLDLFSIYEEKFKEPQAIVLSIFFHKLEYHPRSGDSETLSLECFNKFTMEAGENLKDNSLCSIVYTLIEASATNLTEAHMKKGTYGCDDVHFFLDMIVASLGSSPEQYNQYATKMQAEFSHLSSAAYNSLRLKILTNLLLIPNVYSTKEFQDERESQARTNIQTEIEKLGRADS